jgi:hypothetical protein
VVSINEVRLGAFRALSFEQGAAAWAVVMPGAGYSVQAPLLWYARAAALTAGRSVLVITDAFDREQDEPPRWVEDRVRAALDHLRGQDAHPLLVAKSLTSLAAPLAARERLPAVWLTPLIAQGGTSVATPVLDGLRAATAPRLLVGGSADPTWDRTAAASLDGADTLELPDADHSLEVPGDVTRSLANLKVVTDAVSRFARRLQ